MNESQGVKLIAEERARQRDEEGYQDGHDDLHINEELVMAAISYAMPPSRRAEDPDGVASLWPWKVTEPESFKPTPGDRMRELTKAGALLAAEIDRLGRMVVRTYWNGEEAQACRCRVVVADAPEFKHYWAREFVGQERDAVMVKYDERTFFIDNEGREDHGTYPGHGWHKVTVGMGSPREPHSDLKVERIISTETDGAC